MDQKYRDSIIQKLSEMAKLGFKILPGNLTDKLIYKNEYITVNVNFDVFVDGGSFHVSLFKNNENKGFQFDDYLDHVAKLADYKMKDHETNEIYIDRFTKILLNELLNNLLPVVKGHSWVDVPTNYRGYK